MPTRSAAVRKDPTPAPPPVAPQNAALVKLAQNFSIELAPFSKGEQLAAYHTNAAALVVITGKDTHQRGLELIKEGKGLKRDIEEHWKRITRWLDARKDDVRAIMRDDLALAERDLARLNTLVITFENAERERIRVEEERQRQEQLRVENERRAREQAALEEAALKAEQNSDDLSDRERAFVQRVYAALGVDAASERWLNAVAKACGFHRDDYGVTLMKRPKITDAIAGLTQAAAIRQQAVAVAEKPIEVKKVEVESRLGKVAGMGTTVTYTGECVDYRAFVEAFKRDEVDIETFCEMTQPSETGGNAKARALKENLDRIPGWRHSRKDTKRG